MSKKGLKSRKRREQTIAIIIVAAVVLIATAAILIFAASKNENLGNSEHDHDHNSQSKVELNLKVSLMGDEHSIHYASLKAFEEAVEKQSNGEILVTIEESGKLGTEANVLESMVKGKKVADIVITDVANLTSYDDRMDISALPFLFSSYEEANRFMNSSIQSEIESTLISKNIRVLAHYTDGFDYLLANKPVSNVKDMVGLKVSAIDQKFIATTIRSLKAEPKLSDAAGIYQVLKNKESDAYMGSLDVAVNYRLYQTQQYLSMTYHKYHALAFVISEDTWKSLTESQQNIIKSAAKESENIDVKTTKTNEENLISRIESAGVRKIYPDLKSMVELGAAIIRGYQAQYSSYVERIISEYMN